MRQTLMMGLIACAIALVTSFASAREPEVTKVDVDADIVIGQDGSVRDVQVGEHVAPGVAALVKNAVMRWRFEPVVRNGKPVMAKTGLTMDLAATQSGAGYSLRIQHVVFVSSRSRPLKFVLPGVSMSMMPVGTSFDMLAAMRVNPQGDVVDAALLSFHVLGGGGREPRHLRENMATAMEHALKRSKFRPADAAAGERGDDTFYLPLEYRNALGRGQSLSIAERFSDATPVPWLAPDQQPKLIDLPESRNGLPVAMGNADVRLAPQVVGATL